MARRRSAQHLRGHIATERGGPGVRGWLCACSGRSRLSSGAEAHEAKRVESVRSRARTSQMRASCAQPAVGQRMACAAWRVTAWSACLSGRARAQRLPRRDAESSGDAADVERVSRRRRCPLLPSAARCSLPVKLPLHSSRRILTPPAPPSLAPLDLGSRSVCAHRSHGLCVMGHAKRRVDVTCVSSCFVGRACVRARPPPPGRARRSSEIRPRPGPAAPNERFVRVCLESP